MKKKILREIKGKKGQHLNDREVTMIRDGQIDGLLLLDVEKRAYTVNLVYNVDGLIPLRDFLQTNGVDKRLLVLLLRSILTILKGIDENRFSRDLLVWSIENVYIEPSSLCVYMTYVPLQPFNTEGNLKTFLLDVISSCNFLQEEDTEYIRVLIQELNTVTAYTAGMLESFCDRVSDDLINSTKQQDEQTVCQFCKSSLTSKEESCPYCGKRTGQKNYDYQNKISIFKEEALQGSVSVNKDENGVVTIFKGTGTKECCLWLEGIGSTERIPVRKTPFRIGKMEGITDYRIINRRVSRKHADIVKEQGKYYILDLDSTNGTYIDGRRLQPGVKEELSHGSHLRLADSEFEIHII